MSESVVGTCGAGSSKMCGYLAPVTDYCAEEFQT